MSALVDYVTAFTARGACTCGQCFDAPPEPEKHQPDGHTADVYFFKVAKHAGANAERLRALILEHKGEFCECNPLDGGEHSYIELGAWIGDQGLALMLIGLGALVGLWQIVTPKILPGLDKMLMDQMAGAGLISIWPVRQKSEMTETATV